LSQGLGNTAVCAFIIKDVLRRYPQSCIGKRDGKEQPLNQASVAANRASYVPL
jgi:hypothetical protein